MRELFFRVLFSREKNIDDGENSLTLSSFFSLFFLLLFYTNKKNIPELP